MEISTLLAAGGVYIDVSVSSKKRALEVLSGLLVESGAPLPESEIFNGLIARERLGSTGLGHGVAIPHGRFPGLTQTHAVFVRFEQPIDFDAIDAEPVDLVVALMVPEECTDEHLQLLAALAEMFGNESVREQLRSASTTDEVQSIIASQQPDPEKAASSA